MSVDGVVDEFRPGGSGGWDNLTTTEIVSPVVTKTGTGDVPEPVVLGEDRTAPQQTIDAEDPKSVEYDLSLIHISEPTRPCGTSRMPSSA